MSSTGGSSGGPNKPLNGRVFRNSKRVECELCQTVRPCIDSHGLVTCQRCQAEFLPASGGVLYFG